MTVHPSAIPLTAHTAFIDGQILDQVLASPPLRPFDAVMASLIGQEAEQEMPALNSADPVEGAQGEHSAEDTPLSRGSKFAVSEKASDRPVSASLEINDRDPSPTVQPAEKKENQAVPDLTASLAPPLTPPDTATAAAHNRSTQLQFGDTDVVTSDTPTVYSLPEALRHDPLQRHRNPIQDANANPLETGRHSPASATPTTSPIIAPSLPDEESLRSLPLPKMRDPERPGSHPGPESVPFLSFSERETPGEPLPRIASNHAPPPDWSAAEQTQLPSRPGHMRTTDLPARAIHDRGPPLPAKLEAQTHLPNTQTLQGTPHMDPVAKAAGAKAATRHPLELAVSVAPPPESAISPGPGRNAPKGAAVVPDRSDTSHLRPTIPATPVNSRSLAESQVEGPPVSSVTVGEPVLRRQPEPVPAPVAPPQGLVRQTLVDSRSEEAKPQTEAGMRSAPWPESVIPPSGILPASGSTTARVRASADRPDIGHLPRPMEPPEGRGPASTAPDQRASMSRSNQTQLRGSGQSSPAQPSTAVPPAPAPGAPERPKLSIQESASYPKVSVDSGPGIRPEPPVSASAARKTVDGSDIVTLPRVTHLDISKGGQLVQVQTKSDFAAGQSAMQILSAPAPTQPELPPKSDAITRQHGVQAKPDTKGVQPSLLQGHTKSDPTAGQSAMQVRSAPASGQPQLPPKSETITRQHGVQAKPDTKGEQPSIQSMPQSGSRAHVEPAVAPSAIIETPSDRRSAGAEPNVPASLRHAVATTFTPKPPRFADAEVPLERLATVRVAEPAAPRQAGEVKATPSAQGNVAPSAHRVSAFPMTPDRTAPGDTTSAKGAERQVIRHSDVHRPVPSQTAGAPLAAAIAAGPPKPVQSVSRVEEEIRVGGMTGSDAEEGYVFARLGADGVSAPSSPTAPPPSATARAVLVQIAQAMPQPGQQSVEITLNPEELGRVRLSLSSTDGVLTMTLTADRAETLDLMRRHAAELGQEYRALGYSDIDFQFQQHGSDTGPSGRHATAESAGPGQPEELTATMPNPAARPVQTGLDIRI